MTFIATKLFHKAGEGSGGGGGGDQHNLGWYATESALTTAHPTATAGDWAIVGSTDTVWLWDTDNEEWVDSDQKGQVTSVNGQTGDVVLDLLPAQTGNAGKFLTTDGTDASWSDKPLVNTATGTNALTILGTPTTTVRALNIGYNCSATTNAPNATAIGYNCVADGSSAIAIGTDAKATGSSSIAINGQANMPTQGAKAVAIGAKVSGDKSIVIMTGYTNYYTNITASYATVLGYIANPNTIESNSFYVGVGIKNNQTVKLLGSDGTIPSDRLIHAINKYSTMPTAASTNEGWIVQFTGTTDSTYTHGHLYECVSDGQTPATYSWTEVQLGGGSSLPSQTGNSGKFLTTDGTDASWSDKPLVNTATASNSLSVLGSPASGARSINIGKNSSTSFSTDSVAIGYNSSASSGGVAIGSGAKATGMGGIQIGSATNTDAYTVKFFNGNANYEIMSSNGTIPAARHAALPAADGTYTLQLVIADGVPTLSWVAV